MSTTLEDTIESLDTCLTQMRTALKNPSGNPFAIVLRRTKKLDKITSLREDLEKKNNTSLSCETFESVSTWSKKLFHRMGYFCHFTDHATWIPIQVLLASLKEALYGLLEAIQLEQKALDMIDVTVTEDKGTSSYSESTTTTTSEDSETDSSETLSSRSTEQDTTSVTSTAESAEVEEIGQVLEQIRLGPNDPGTRETTIHWNSLWSHLVVGLVEEVDSRMNPNEEGSLRTIRNRLIHRTYYEDGENGSLHQQLIDNRSVFRMGFLTAFRHLLALCKEHLYLHENVFFVKRDGETFDTAALTAIWQECGIDLTDLENAIENVFPGVRAHRMASNKFNRWKSFYCTFPKWTIEHQNQYRPAWQMLDKYLRTNQPLRHGPVFPSLEIFDHIEEREKSLVHIFERKQKQTFNRSRIDFVSFVESKVSVQFDGNYYLTTGNLLKILLEKIKIDYQNPDRVKSVLHMCYCLEKIIDQVPKLFFFPRVLALHNQGRLLEQQMRIHSDFAFYFEYQSNIEFDHMLQQVRRRLNISRIH